MARKSILMPAVLAAALCMVAFQTAFVGTQKPALRASKVARQAGDIYEIFVTASSVGLRTRMNVTPETTVSSVLEDARKSLGFDQDFLASSDFKVYLKEDESTPITGKMGDLDLKPWSPDGIELHIKYEPAV